MFIVGSLVPPEAIPDLTGIEGLILVGQEGVLSDWWRLDQAGCRAGSLSAHFDFTAGPFTCSDPWQGQAAGSVGIIYPYTGVTVPQGSPPPPPWAPANTLLLDVFCAVGDPGVAVTPDQEYYAFSITIRKDRTVGACAGCATPTELFLYSELLSRSPGSVDVWVFGDGTAQTVCYDGACQPVPARRSTWGQVKALYR
jgi:hypothetical protein